MAEQTLGSTFVREARYIVFKVKDVEAFLPQHAQDILCTLGNAIHEGRMAAGKAPFLAAVVEHDWPEYEIVWSAIEARVTGKAKRKRVKPNDINYCRAIRGYCEGLGQVHEANDRLTARIGQLEIFSAAATQAGGQNLGRIAQLEEALRFYADRKNYDQFGICHEPRPGCSCGQKHNHPDMGRIARAALGEA